MTGASFETKCLIVDEVHQQFIDDAEWADFFENNDMGVPLAVLIVLDAAEATESGAAWIELSWHDLCERLDIDPTLDYENLAAMLVESQNRHS